MEKRKVIIDCDPGHDDAIALLVAFANMDKIEIQGITTVCGNTSLENTTKNALKLCEFANVDIDVYAGYSRPLVRQPYSADYAHGKTGLDGAKIADTTKVAKQKHAIKFIKETLEKEDKVTIVAIGPLTNIAGFIKTYPHLTNKIDELIIMGGSMYSGNILSKAEFNFFEDPESAKIVIDSGLNITLAPIEVCDQAGVSFDEIENFNNGGKYSKVVYDIFSFYGKGRKSRGFDDVVIFDLTTIVYLLKPEIFDWQMHKVTVETQGNDTLGMSVFDFRKRVTEQEKNIRTLMNLDREKYMELLYSSIESLDRK